MHGLRREGDGRSASARRSGSEHWRAGLDPSGLGGAAARTVYWSWAIPGSETAPGPGRSPAASTVALKVGGMQKMLTSVEGCPAPSLMSPATEPVSVIVWAPNLAGPKAPGFRCTQSGHAPPPSVQAAVLVPPTLQALNVGWSQVPVFAPVQHFQGVLRPVQLQVPVPVPLQQPAGTWSPVHCGFALLCGHPGNGSPSKQPVPLPLESRQKPQKTLFWLTQVPVPDALQQPLGIWSPVHCAFAL